jgi:hypothetical protein
MEGAWAPTLISNTVHGIGLNLGEISGEASHGVDTDHRLHYINQRPRNSDFPFYFSSVFHIPAGTPPNHMNHNRGVYLHFWINFTVTFYCMFNPGRDLCDSLCFKWFIALFRGYNVAFNTADVDLEPYIFFGRQIAPLWAPQERSRKRLRRFRPR